MAFGDAPGNHVHSNTNPIKKRVPARTHHNHSPGGSTMVVPSPLQADHGHSFRSGTAYISCWNMPTTRVLIVIAAAYLTSIVLNKMPSLGDYTPIPTQSPTFLAAISNPPMTDPVGQASKEEEEKVASLAATAIPKEKPVTVAYAISLVKCGDKQSTSAGLVDAALVMRHSIHLQSSRNPNSGSRYDYKMYAIVHRQAMECSRVLETAGFTIVVKDPPLQPSEIVGSAHLRQHIHKEWCCGHDEFIKLYAYELPGDEPIVVHVDIDFAFYQPMDDLYDAILLPPQDPRAKLARSRIPLERPSEHGLVVDHNRIIDAFITRDYPQLLPGRVPGYQAGFLVARKDPTVVPELVDVIRYHDYEGGYSRQNGWGNKGYGGYVGAMAMQGLMAYYYDVIRPNTTVELNSCRFNHMGMDNLYRANPNFKKNSEWVGKCRSTLPDCEDCTMTNVSQIYNVHYTQCRKPWNCVAQGVDGGNKGSAIDTNTGKLEHCLPLIQKWHDIRKDLQDNLMAFTKDASISEGATGTYRKELFHGHCKGEGPSGYLQIQAKTETFAKIPAMYGDPPLVASQ